MTAEAVSARSGDTSVGVSSEAKQLNTWRVSDYTPEYRQTRSIGKRRLLTPDEVLRLPLDTALIILRGQKVLKVEKYDYTLHPDAKKLIPKKASDHIPKWRQSKDQDEFDHMPSIPSKPKRKRATGASSSKRVKETALAANEPVYQEPEYEDFPDDLLREDFMDEPPYPEMVPLDKDSIMS